MHTLVATTRYFFLKKKKFAREKSSSSHKNDGPPIFSSTHIILIESDTMHCTTLASASSFSASFSFGAVGVLPRASRTRGTMNANTINSSEHPLRERSCCCVFRRRVQRTGRRVKARIVVVKASSSSSSDDNDNTDTAKNGGKKHQSSSLSQQAQLVVPAFVAGVVGVHAIQKPPSAFAASSSSSKSTNINNNGERKEASSTAIRELRKASKSAVKLSLAVTKSTIAVVDQKINEPWNVEDIWAIFALRLIIKRRREIFLWFEKQKMKAFGGGYDPKREELIKQLESEEVPDSPYRETFAHWVGKPLSALMFLWITGYIFDVTCEFVDAMYVNFAVPENVADGFDRGTYIFTAGLVVSMWISKYGSQMLKKIFPDSSAQTEEGKKLILVRLASVLTLFATCAATLVTFGLPTSLLFSFGGLGGLAFGLAAKDFIANLIGGIIIAITSPFSEGDQIVLLGSGGKFRGSDSPKISEYRVEKIGWYSTMLMPRDTKPTIVPNGYFLGNATVNHSRASHRFFRGAFEVRYEDVDQAIQIKDAINDYLEKHPKVDVKAGSKALISNLGSAKLEMEVRVFIPMADGADAFYNLRQDICLEVCRVLEVHAPMSAGTTPLLLAQDGSFDGILSS